jgi:hypothetical protein
MVKHKRQGKANIPEYLYSFSFGSCDWRMYTIFAPSQVFRRVLQFQEKQTRLIP